MGATNDGDANPNRLDVWGDQLMNKLSVRSRAQRKRQASKWRRVLSRRDVAARLDDAAQ